MDFANLIESKIINTDKLHSYIQELKATHNTVVFTNGCFDVLHYGHVSYLTKARSLGSKLIIGLNSDSSVKKLKGESRPINNQKARAILLASFIFVDAVIIFDEETPENLIKMISPDILVKGGDYKFEDIVGADFITANGGSVKIIPFEEGYSSTNIIKNIGRE